MALSDLTPTAVEAAIEEYDQLGRDEFLERYGFARARGYFIHHRGRRYDSKAVAGAAHGFLAPDAPALGPKDFSGGERRVAGRLR